MTKKQILKQLTKAQKLFMADDMDYSWEKAMDILLKLRQAIAKDLKQTKDMKYASDEK